VKVAIQRAMNHSLSAIIPFARNYLETAVFSA
jgi:hypothetical protein